MVKQPKKSYQIKVRYFLLHVTSKSDMGSNKLYKNKYMLNELRSNTKKFVNKVDSIDINKLQVNKLFVYNADKKSLANVFDNSCQACRVLTSLRCKNLT
jgi:hypothetical protein